MEWTRNKPTVPGWYWYRGGIFTPAPVAINISYRGSVLVGYLGLDRIELSNANGEWAGPIAEPSEPSGHELITEYIVDGQRILPTHLLCKSEYVDTARRIIEATKGTA